VEGLLLDYQDSPFFVHFHNELKEVSVSLRKGHNAIGTDSELVTYAISNAISVERRISCNRNLPE
jgi:hypothetical protein